MRSQIYPLLICAAIAFLPGCASNKKKPTVLMSVKHGTAVQSPSQQPLVSAQTAVTAPTGSVRSVPLKKKAEDLALREWEQFATAATERIVSSPSLQNKELAFSVRDNASDLEQYLFGYISTLLSEKQVTISRDSKVVLILDSECSFTAKPVVGLHLRLRDRGDLVFAIVHTANVERRALSRYMPKGAIFDKNGRPIQDPFKSFQMTGN